MVDIEKLRALLSQASPGPWNHKGYGFGCKGYRLGTDQQSHGVGFCHGFQDGAEDKLEIGLVNASLVVAAVNALPELLAIAEAAFVAVDEGRKMVAEAALAEGRKPDLDVPWLAQNLVRAVDAARGK